MKVKLLKKIRKRFSWYKKTKENAWIVIDHKTQNVTEVNLEYCYDDRGLKTQGQIDKFNESLEVSKETWVLRNVQDIILKPFGYSFSSLFYRGAVRRYKSKIKRK